MYLYIGPYRNIVCWEVIYRWQYHLSNQVVFQWLFFNFIVWIFSKTAISRYSSKVTTHVDGWTEGLSTEIVSRDGSWEVRHFKIQRTSTIVLNNKGPKVGCWYSLRNISVIKLCFLIPVQVMVTKFKLPTVVYALRWDHHESGVRDQMMWVTTARCTLFNTGTSNYKNSY